MIAYLLQSYTSSVSSVKDIFLEFEMVKIL